MFGSPKVIQQILTVIEDKEYRLWEARLPTNGTISLKMVENQLSKIDASLTKDMQDTQYEYHCPELPVQPLAVLSSLELKGFN
nr:hypothetical protein [Marinomonas sp. A3A]